MHKRRTLAVALVAVALVVGFLSVAGVAAAQSTASSSPAPSAAAIGAVAVTGAVPEIGAKEAWTGDQVRVNFESNGHTIVASKCELYIGGNKQAIEAQFQNMSLKTETLVWMFTGDKVLGKGSYEFKVVLVDSKGEAFPYSWSFSSTGVASGGALINFHVMKVWWPFILKGAYATVSLTVISMALACIFALFGSLGRLSKKLTFKQGWERYRSWGYMGSMVVRRIPYWVATFYTSLFRGTPLLLQITFIYLAVPEVIKALGLPQRYNPPAFWSGVAALSLNYGAYLTEVFRAGIQAVPKGQNEAAWAIGLSPWQTQRRVVLPQAFKIVIPAIGNDFIALIKDTSLVSTITVEETLRKSQLAGASSFNFVSTLLVAAAIYWALTIFFSFWQAKLENRMARDKAREKKGRK